jgi:hypothetical protein
MPHSGTERTFREFIFLEICIRGTNKCGFEPPEEYFGARSQGFAVASWRIFSSSS